jgi:glycosyltransferase involved in cell wall biosynthesis
VTVTVAMGYWNCPDLVERAVRSVLDQTYRDLHLVVIGDGQDPPLSGVRDSRLEVYRLPENHGAYFAMQLVLEASPHRWFGPFGADDYAEPDHYEALGKIVAKEKTHAVAVNGLYWGEGKDRITNKGLYEVGIFRRSRLLAFGGYDPSARMAQDSLMIALLNRTGPVSKSIAPTYHRIKRQGSLTTSVGSSLRSPERLAVMARNREILSRCERLRRPEAMAQYRRSLVPQAVLDDLAEHVARLRPLLGVKAAA